MSKGFNLGEYLKGSGPMRASAPTEDGGSVSELNIGREELRYLPLDQIDPDPTNFYSLEGLDELAGNIELIGLQQPLRVRPNGERWTVVSGHRRRAACMMIRDGGNAMFDKGVPCLVDYGEASDAMRELRLIFANSATRVMSSAEQSKQAERVTELLYQLKEQGVEFPGRMRDHVAEACNLSRSKIGRLQAIRGNLIPGFLAEYDAGRINESVAYRISQEDAVIQKDLSEYPRAALRGLTEKTVDGMIEAIKARRKPVGADPQISPKNDGPMRASAPTEDEDDGGPMRASAPTEDEDGPAVSILDLVPRWQTGTPARAGRYLCRLDLGLNKLTEQRCDFRDGAWTAYGRPVSDVGEVVDWWPLPEAG